MVKSVHTVLEVDIPDNVEVSVDGMKVRVSGPLGKLEKDFSHARSITIKKENNKVVLEAYYPKKGQLAVLGSVRSHIKNMILGVTQGYKYVMKIVYAHFPISVKFVPGTREVFIENFLGEKSSRKTQVLPGVNVKIEKDDIILTGIDIEAVGQSAANIQQATKIKEKDPRIFQDGIYVYRKYVGEKLLWKIL
ncbi:MAG: 50S ribosomal protein L6 [Candidatus Freyarchaeota archaeon]|nr:50S ribosomal protein L6 [Candidatus Jordarchaeia archaeon]